MSGELPSVDLRTASRFIAASGFEVSDASGADDCETHGYPLVGPYGVPLVARDTPYRVTILTLHQPCRSAILGAGCPGVRARWAVTTRVPSSTW